MKLLSVTLLQKIIYYMLNKILRFGFVNDEYVNWLKSAEVIECNTEVAMERTRWSYLLSIK